MILGILLAGLAYAILIHPFVVYLRDSKSLRRFPAPSFAGVSSLWRISKNVRFQHFRAVHDAHQRLGTHVRIAPNHISISDPAAIPELYGHGANFMKDGFYDGGAGAHRSMADARDKIEHQGKRKILAHVFAQKTIAELEPMMLDTLSVLVAQVDKHAQEGRAINMRRFLNYFTIDVFSRLLFGKTQGCLERGDDMVNAETSDGKVYQVPLIKTLHDGVIINTILGMEAPLLPLTKPLFARLHPKARSGAHWDNMIRHHTKQRLAAENSTTQPADIFSKLLTTSKGAPTNLPLGAIHAECSSLMNAGTDTTTAALTSTLYLLHKHPAALARLRADLDAALGPATAAELPAPASFDALSRIPYLRACIEESLRVRPPSSFGLPRVVPAGGRVVAGAFVAGGVTVSVPTYTILRDPHAFDRAEEYVPERWLSGDRERMAKAHFPFSTGPRACIGRNISYYEQTLVVAALVRAFEFEFAEGAAFELRTIERFNSNPGEMVMKCRRRV